MEHSNTSDPVSTLASSLLSTFGVGLTFLRAASRMRPSIERPRKRRRNSQTQRGPSRKRQKVDSFVPRSRLFTRARFTWTCHADLDTAGDSLAIDADEEEDPEQLLVTSFKRNPSGWDVIHPDTVLSLEAPSRLRWKSVIDSSLLVVNVKDDVHRMEWIGGAGSPSRLLLVVVKPSGMTYPIGGDFPDASFRAPLVFRVSPQLRVTFCAQLLFGQAHGFLFDAKSKLVEFGDGETGSVLATCFGDGTLIVSVMPVFPLSDGPMAVSSYRFPDSLDKTTFRCAVLDQMMCPTAFTVLTWTEDARYLVAGGLDGQLHLWAVNPTSDDCRLTYSTVVEGHFPLGTKMKSCAVRNFGTSTLHPGVVASCGDDGVVKMWDLQDFSNPMSMTKAAAGDSLVSIVFPPESTEAVFASHDGSLRQLRGSSSQGPILEFSSPIMCLDLDLGKCVFCTDSGELIAVRSTTSNLKRYGNQRRGSAAGVCRHLMFTFPCEGNRIVYGFPSLDGTALKKAGFKVGLKIDQQPVFRRRDLSLQSCKLCKLKPEGRPAVDVVAVAGNGGLVWLLRDAS